jgi:hypothetical protein
MSKSDRIRQGRTRALAGNHRRPWEPHEVELLSRDDLTLEDMAHRLGRTYAAIENKRRSMRREAEFDAMLRERGLA